MKIVYAHEVLYNRYEGGWTVKDIYATKKTAWMAMRLSLIEQFNATREDWFLYGRTVFERGNVWQYKHYDDQRIKAYKVKGEK